MVENIATLLHPVIELFRSSKYVLLFHCCCYVTLITLISSSHHSQLSSHNAIAYFLLQLFAGY